MSSNAGSRRSSARQATRTPSRTSRKANSNSYSRKAKGKSKGSNSSYASRSSSRRNSFDANRNSPASKRKASNANRAPARKSPKGSKGYSGNRGNKGSKSYNGNKSPKGYNGNKSPKGYKGNKSPKGYSGKKGPKGYGKKGPKGYIGSKGYGKKYGKKNGNGYGHAGSPRYRRSSGYWWPGWWGHRPVHARYYPVPRYRRYWRPYYHYLTPVDATFAFWLGFPVVVYEERVVVLDPPEEEVVYVYDERPYDEWEDPEPEYTESYSYEYEDEGYSDGVEEDSDEMFRKLEAEEGGFDYDDIDQSYGTPVTNMGTVEPDPEIAVEAGEANYYRTMEVEILDLINAERKAHGLEPVRGEARLAACARQHSREMHQLDYFDHESPTDQYRTLPDRVKRAGVANYGWAGENIAMSSRPTASNFVEMWMQSPGHRANILRPEYKFSGIGVFGDGERVFATQVFTSNQ